MKTTLIALILGTCTWVACSEPVSPRSSRWVHPGEAQGFNPQPDPPARPGHVNPGEAQGFNPQPDPPARPGMFRRPDWNARPFRAARGRR